MAARKSAPPVKKVRLKKPWELTAWLYPINAELGHSTGWTDSDLERGYEHGWSTYTVDYTRRHKTVVRVYDHHGTMCDQAVGIRAQEMRRLRARFENTGIRPFEWTKEELHLGRKGLEGREETKWRYYAFGKTAEGLISVKILAPIGASLREKLALLRPWPIQLIGVLPAHIPTLRARMKKAGLEEVPTRSLEAGVEEGFLSAVKVKRPPHFRLAAQTYLHQRDALGRHLVSLPELGIVFDPMRSKKAMALIARMEKDGLKRHPLSVPLAMAP
jgi:hypothetical protein